MLGAVLQRIPALHLQPAPSVVAQRSRRLDALLADLSEMAQTEACDDSASRTKTEHQLEHKSVSEGVSQSFQQNSKQPSCKKACERPRLSWQVPDRGKLCSAYSPPRSPTDFVPPCNSPTLISREHVPAPSTSTGSRKGPPKQTPALWDVARGAPIPSFAESPPYRPEVTSPPYRPEVERPTYPPHGASPSCSSQAQRPTNDTDEFEVDNSGNNGAERSEDCGLDTAYNSPKMQSLSAREANYSPSRPNFSSVRPVSPLLLPGAANSKRHNENSCSTPEYSLSQDEDQGKKLPRVNVNVFVPPSDGPTSAGDQSCNSPNYWPSQFDSKGNKLPDVTSKGLLAPSESPKSCPERSGDTRKFSASQLDEKANTLSHVKLKVLLPPPDTRSSSHRTKPDDRVVKQNNAETKTQLQRKHKDIPTVRVAVPAFPFDLDPCVILAKVDMRLRLEPDTSIKVLEHFATEHDGCVFLDDVMLRSIPGFALSQEFIEYAHNVVTAQVEALSTWTGPPLTQSRYPTASRTICDDQVETELVRRPKNRVPLSEWRNNAVFIDRRDGHSLSGYRAGVAGIAAIPARLVRTSGGRISVCCDSPALSPTKVALGYLEQLGLLASSVAPQSLPTLSTAAHLGYRPDSLCLSEKNNAAHPVLKVYEDDASGLEQVLEALRATIALTGLASFLAPFSRPGPRTISAAHHRAWVHGEVSDLLSPCWPLDLAALELAETRAVAASLTAAAITRAAQSASTPKLEYQRARSHGNSTRGRGKQFNTGPHRQRWGRDQDRHNSTLTETKTQSSSLGPEDKHIKTSPYRADHSNRSDTARDRVSESAIFRPFMCAAQQEDERVKKKHKIC